MAVKMSPIQIARRITLGAILVALTVATFLHQKFQGFPSIDALCPFGGFESMLKFFTSGDFVSKIQPGTMVLAFGVVALGIVLSRFFCGWFCAFGALQSIFGWIGKKLFKNKRPIVPVKIDRYLRFLKYLILAAIIFFTWQAGELIIRPYDPWAAYAHLSAGFAEVWAEFAFGLILLVASLLLSIVYDRAFCKYICPLGAINAILSRIPLFRIKREKTSCISCSKCDKICPMNVDISKPDAITSSECIGCMECITACPTKPNSLIATLAGKKIKLLLIIIIGFAIYGTAVIVGKTLGYTGKSLTELAATGTLNLTDIKGSSTWEMVAASFGIDIEKLYREAGVDMNKVPKTTMIKETGKVGGYTDFEADAVRFAVAKILGIPYEGESKEVDATKEVETVKEPSAQEGSLNFTAPADFELEGTMTIDEIAAALKVSPEAVIAKLKLPLDIARNKTIKEMKEQYGYSIPELKTRIKE